MGHPRLLAVDLDGTLLNSRHRISPANAVAVKRAVAEGMVVLPATSRAPAAIAPQLRALGLVGPAEHPFLASQGAFVGALTDQGWVTYRQRPMPLSAVRSLLDSLDPRLAVNWYSAARWLVGESGPLVVREAQIVGLEPEVVDLSAQATGPDKLLVLSGTDSTDLLRRVRVPAGLAAVQSTPTHLEVTADGVSKGEALAWLCARLGIDPSEAAAMGDGHNDLPMLRTAGVAVAPANAEASVRSQADLVTPDNDHDAVASALATLLGW